MPEVWKRCQFLSERRAKILDFTISFDFYQQHSCCPYFSRHALSMAAVSCAFCFVQALTPNSKGVYSCWAGQGLKPSCSAIRRSNLRHAIEIQQDIQWFLMILMRIRMIFLHNTQCLTNLAVWSLSEACHPHFNVANSVIPVSNVLSQLKLVIHVQVFVCHTSTTYLGNAEHPSTSWGSIS